MKLVGLILICFLCWLLINCGGDKSVDAEQAFLKGDYTTAIEGYLQVHQKDTTNQRVNERLALAYMYRGQELYKKTNNLSSFARNFDQGVKFIPLEPSAEFRRIYSQILFQLGSGYYKARPTNTIEKEDFLNKTMTMMHQALDMDSTNVNAQNVLDEIKLNNYQKIVDKAKSIFDRAQRTNDINSYFEAETNIRKAQSMNGTTAEMRRMLSIIHAKTLGVLNYEDGLALAVYKNEFSSGKVILTLAIKSYLSYPVTLSLDNFVLADYRGTMYNVDKEIMTRDFNMSGVRPVTLDRQNNYTDGSLVFSIPDSMHLDYLGYRISAGRISKKFFP